MIRWMKRLFRIKDVADVTKEFIDPCDKETKKVKKLHEQEFYETIKVVNKINKEMRKKSVINSMYLVVKE